MVYEATEYPSNFEYIAGLNESLDCGYLYMVRVSAVNVAGEGPYIADSVHLGNVPSNPKSPMMLSVVPDVELVLSWERPFTDGCLPITQYVLNKDGVDLADVINPAENTFTDDLTVGGSTGTEIKYKVKAKNVNGFSEYS